MLRLFSSSAWYVASKSESNSTGAFVGLVATVGEQTFFAKSRYLSHEEKVKHVPKEIEQLLMDKVRFPLPFL